MHRKEDKAKRISTTRITTSISSEAHDLKQIRQLKEKVRYIKRAHV